MKQTLDIPIVQAQIIDLNTQEQLFEKGVDSTGVSLGEYSPNTIEGTRFYLGKKQKGQRYDHITLRDTGDFYKSFRFLNFSDYFTFEADTIKDGTDPNEKYPDILGLTDASKTEASDIVLPHLAEIVRKKITGAMS